MFPGMGGRGMNPKKLNAMMRQMGIELEDVDDVEEVRIRTAEKEYVFRDATVSKMTAQGQVTWQLMGTPEIRPRAPSSAAATDAGPTAPGAPGAPPPPAFTEEDVKLVMAQAKVSREQAVRALEAAHGEPAEAIVKLLEEDEDSA